MESRIESAINQLRSREQGSFYLYDRETIDRKINQLATGFGPYHFLYSVKTNPFPDVVGHILGKGLGADAASAAEVDLAAKMGAGPENIYYSAPGKTRRDIESTLEKCTIVADSYGEIRLLNTIAEEKGVHLNIGVRLNPDFSMFGGTGDSSKFGIDEETLADHKELLESCSALSIVGIHVHLRSQVLDADTLALYYRRIFEKAVYCQTQLGWQLAFINFGGGLGIPYSSTRDQALDIPALGSACGGIMEEYSALSGAKLIIETGRFLVCESGWYVSPVIDVKESRGTKYIVVQNGLNGFLRPSIAAMFKGIGVSDSADISAEPLYTKMDAFDFAVLGKNNSANPEKVTICGNLCTAMDVVASGVLLPHIDVGDCIVVSKAGSYAYSLSPMLFSSQPVPTQVLV